MNNTLVEFNTIDLTEQWEQFLRRRKTGRRTQRSRDGFRALLRRTVTNPDDIIDDVVFCTDCYRPVHDDDAQVVQTDRWSRRSGQHPGRQRLVCNHCFDRYSECAGCDNAFWPSLLTTVDGGADVCGNCLDAYSWCDDCEVYFYSGDGGHNHRQDDCCESPAQTFTIRNDGQPPLANDTRVTVTLPAGVISNEGIVEIGNYLRQHARSIEGLSYLAPGTEAGSLWRLAYDLDEVGEKWQTKEGNYTKRLSRLAYKRYELKLRPEVISQIGNIASAHARAIDFKVETTRNLNLDPSQFANNGSCWWDSYSESRCALKTNGGFGIRTFTEGREMVTGRAWVLPLRKTTCRAESRVDSIETKARNLQSLTPTFETLNPDAYVVFNGYGDLEEYTGARLLSHMAGMTYRKITFRCTPMYVNSNSGYLVAPETIASRYTNGELCLDLNQHSDLYTTETQKKKVLILA